MQDSTRFGYGKSHFLFFKKELTLNVLMRFLRNCCILLGWLQKVVGISIVGLPFFFVSRFWELGCRTD